MKIINTTLANKKMSTSAGLVEFDAEGIAIIEDVELFNNLLQCNGFTSFGHDKKNEAKSVEVSSVVQEQEQVPNDAPPIQEEGIDLKSLSVKELTAIAKEMGVHIGSAPIKKDVLIAKIKEVQAS